MQVVAGQCWTMPRCVRVELAWAYTVVYMLRFTVCSEWLGSCGKVVRGWLGPAPSTTRVAWLAIPSQQQQQQSLQVEPAIRVAEAPLSYRNDSKSRFLGKRATLRNSNARTNATWQSRLPTASTPWQARNQQLRQLSKPSSHRLTTHNVRVGIVKLSLRHSPYRA